MKFNYIKLPTKDNKRIELPLIPVAFKNGGGCLCLIDSGADYCYLDARIGEALGIDVRSGKFFKSKGITGTEFSAYFHKISFIVGGWDYECIKTIYKFTLYPEDPPGVRVDKIFILNTWCLQ